MNRGENTPGGCFMLIPFVIVTIILGTISFACLQGIRAGLVMYDPKNCVEATFIQDKYKENSSQTKTVQFTYKGEVRTARGNFSEYHTVGEKITVYVHSETKSIQERTPLLFIIPVPILIGAVGFWLFMFKRIIIEKGRNIDWSADDD